MIGLLSLVAAVALSFGQPGPAVDVEAEARAIDALLIAPCCFTQQVSVHPSPAAEDVRRDVRARLAAGQTRQQILDAYVAQYGTRILAAPPARGFALMLYAVPFILIILRRVLRIPLILMFAGVVGAGILLVGYMFNALL